MKTIVPIVILALATPAFAGSQGRPTLGFRGDAGYVWVRSDSAARLRGPVLGGEGRLVLIEGRLVVSARPLPWLEMSVGPFVRAYVTDSVTERWVFWQARARVEAPIVTASLTSYVELWRALSSQVNLVAGAGRVQGGEAGLVYRPPQRPFSLRVAYRVDDAAIGRGAIGSETLEALSLAILVGGR